MKSEKLKLTEAVVAKFKCPAGERQAFLWDTEQPGLGVRALPGYTKNGRPVAGAKTWVVQGRVAGTAKECRYTIGPVSQFWLGPKNEIDADAETKEPDASKVSAREQARRMRLQMKNGLDPLQVQVEAVAAKQASIERNAAEAVTLREVADQYIANKKTRNGPLKANTIRDINAHVDKSFATWANAPIKDITEEMCKQRHHELATRGLTGKRPAPHRARGAFVILRALCNYAIAKIRVNGKKLMTENPANVLNGDMAPPKVRTTKVPMERVGHVWEALRKVRADPAKMPATHTQADALALTLLFGGRASEVLELTWDRVHLEEDAGWLHLPTPKNSNPVTLPLSKPARALLAARTPRKGCPYVFPARSGKGHASTPRGPAMAAAIAAAGCHLNRHALRRTFTTLAVTVLGIELWKIQLLTNHLSTGGNVTLDHYVERNDLRYLAPEAERIGAWIVEQATIASGANVVQLGKKKRA